MCERRTWLEVILSPVRLRRQGVDDGGLQVVLLNRWAHLELLLLSLKLSRQGGLGLQLLKLRYRLHLWHVSNRLPGELGGQLCVEGRSLLHLRHLVDISEQLIRGSYTALKHLSESDLFINRHLIKGPKVLRNVAESMVLASVKSTSSLLCTVEAW